LILPRLLSQLLRPRRPIPLPWTLLLFVLLLFVLPRLMASSLLPLLTLGGCSTVTALALIKQSNTVGEGESFNSLGVGQIKRSISTTMQET